MIWERLLSAWLTRSTRGGSNASVVRSTHYPQRGCHGQGGSACAVAARSLERATDPRKRDQRSALRSRARTRRLSRSRSRHCVRCLAQGEGCASSSTYSAIASKRRPCMSMRTHTMLTQSVAREFRGRAMCPPSTFGPCVRACAHRTSLFHVAPVRYAARMYSIDSCLDIRQTHMRPSLARATREHDRSRSIATARLHRRHATNQM